MYQYEDICKTDGPLNHLCVNNKESSKTELLDFVEKELGEKPYIFSSISNEGIEDLLDALFKNMETNND